MYQLKLHQFEGPFDLLVEVIESKKLSINQIALSEVADQYLAHLKAIENFPLPEASSFLVVASTLMLLKSRTLLPALQLTQEEEAEIKDLEDRVAIYQKYRNLAKQLENIFGKQVIFGREPFARVEEMFIEPRGLTIEKLGLTMSYVVENLPKKETLPSTMVKKTISLEQKMDELVNRFKEKISFCFSDLKKPGCEKVEIIVNFLAILELVKRGFIIARQMSAFNEIELNKNEQQ